MQEIVWLLTLALVFVVASAFLTVISQSAPATSAPPSPPARYRQPLFWMLVVVGALTTYGTLTPWPHSPDPRAANAPLMVNAAAEQWSWDIDRTQLPVNRSIVFAVTSRDVNHGFGIYDASLKLLTQIQAMPGYVNKVHYTFTRPGKYRVMCMEYCGLIHHDMIAELTITP
jgi:cytochrome c oxidase subunit 2